MQTQNVFKMWLSAVSLLLAMSTMAVAQPKGGGIDAASFRCLSEMTKVGDFFVYNLNGDIDATVKVARSKTGGKYPPGSIVQLIPREAMVKREAGFSAATKDWEFFELFVTAESTTIKTRGFAETVNSFGGNCFACHIKARPEWDLICGKDHGCDPVSLTPVTIKALQKTDPRCPPVELSAEETAALEARRKDEARRMELNKRPK